jgi:DNA-binding transcriptional ArsR family regulator
VPEDALEAALSRPISEIKADLFRALAHPARIRALEVLADGERSVGEMQPLVGIE